jgi:(p)ppGpp synthase/HD superfamily hydrolase
VQFYDDMPNDEITEAFLWGRLEPCLTYLSEPDRATVRRAMQLAIHAHEGQIRKSGEPFVSHPVEVTRILAELQAERVRSFQLLFMLRELPL